MEAELLRGMIADRDLRMEKIQRKSQEQVQRNIELCQQLENVTAEVHQQSQQILSEKNQLVSQYRFVINKLEQMQRDFKQQGASLKTYSKDSSILGKVGANGGSGDASYVMRMQAQLCKAMHSLGITDHQMELATKHTELIVKYQKETLIQCREERTSTELNLMNQLIEKDNERRTIEESYQVKLDVIAKERDALERQMEESGHDLEDDDEDNNADEDEEDAEEKEMKQDMMQLLTERRAEIERLETLTEEQEDMIAELEEQVADMINSPNVPQQRKSQELNIALSTEPSKNNNTANNNEVEDGDEEIDEDDEDGDEVPQQESTIISTTQGSDVVLHEVTDNEVDGGNDFDENIVLENFDKTNDSIEPEVVEDEVDEEEDDDDDPTQQDTSTAKGTEEIPITAS